MSEIKVNADNETARGTYANIVSVTAQERDIVIDFISLVNAGSEPQAQLVSRVFLNRFTARELSQLIQVAEQNWEKQRYGVAKTAEPEEGNGKK